MNKKIAIVTGGTSGIGKATALALRGAGYTVYEFSRREAGVEGLHHIRADITDETQVRAAVQQVMDAEGQIDVVVNNAGFGISGAVEFTDTADAQRLFNADFFRHGAREPRRYRAYARGGRGRIVNLSSVGGRCPSVPDVLLRGQGGGQRLYDGAGERTASLRHHRLCRPARRHPHGLHRRAGKDRHRRRGLRRAHQPLRLAHGARRADRHGSCGRGPLPIARVAQKTSHKPIYTIRLDYQFFVFLKRILPYRALNALIGLIYAK